tara:strand:- start:2063 stop:3877 length:1815 start_codon:yes stop_codon:yes gene_type:complete
MSLFGRRSGQFGFSRNVGNALANPSYLRELGQASMFGGLMPQTLNAKTQESEMTKIADSGDPNAIINYSLERARAINNPQLLAAAQKAQQRGVNKANVATIQGFLAELRDPKRTVEERLTTRQNLETFLGDAVASAGLDSEVQGRALSAADQLISQIPQRIQNAANLAVSQGKSQKEFVDQYPAGESAYVAAKAQSIRNEGAIRNEAERIENVSLNSAQENIELELTEIANFAMDERNSPENVKRVQELTDSLIEIARTRPGGQGDLDAALKFYPALVDGVDNSRFNRARMQREQRNSQLASAAKSLSAVLVTNFEDPKRELERRLNLPAEDPDHLPLLMKEFALTEIDNLLRLEGQDSRPLGELTEEEKVFFEDNESMFDELIIAGINDPNAGASTKRRSVKAFRSIYDPEMTRRKSVAFRESQAKQDADTAMQMYFSDPDSNRIRFTFNDGIYDELLSLSRSDDASDQATYTKFLNKLSSKLLADPNIGYRQAIEDVVIEQMPNEIKFSRSVQDRVDARRAANAPMAEQFEKAVREVIRLEATQGGKKEVSNARLDRLYQDRATVERASAVVRAAQAEALRQKANTIMPSPTAVSTMGYPAG